MIVACMIWMTLKILLVWKLAWLSTVVVWWSLERVIGFAHWIVVMIAWSTLEMTEIIVGSVWEIVVARILLLMHALRSKAFVLTMLLVFVMLEKVGPRLVLALMRIGERVVLLRWHVLRRIARRLLWLLHIIL